MSGEGSSSLEWHLRWHSLACSTELDAFSQLFNEDAGFCVCIPLSLSPPPLPPPHTRSQLQCLCNSQPHLLMAACLWWFAISISYEVLLCWLCCAETGAGASCAMSPLAGRGGGRGDFTGIYCVGSQAVASGPPLHFCRFKQTLVISASVRADLDLRRKPACHRTPREWATGSLKHLALTSFLPSLHCFIPPSIPGP